VEDLGREERTYHDGAGKPPRYSGGPIARRYWRNTDIEDLKRAEATPLRAQAEIERVTRLTTMGELAASIAHEMSQSLTAVIMNANACLRSLDGRTPNLDEAKETVLRILKDTKRGCDVIASIRAHLKKAVPDRTRLNISSTIEEVIPLALGEVRRHAVSLQTELAPNCPPVAADRIQLQQVILNLLLNGIEAMAGVNGRRRELRIRSQADGSDSVLVAVQDSGLGLDPRNLSRIFDAFFSTKPGGMGMGLSISRSIIEAHGGRLWATTNPGPGATFQFTLPIAGQSGYDRPGRDRHCGG
jgi:signal transduction histidine kinase